MNFLENLTGAHKTIAIIALVLFFGFLLFKIIREYIIPLFKKK